MTAAQAQEGLTRSRISIEVDQLSSPVGGGRFIRGFLAALFTEAGALDQFEHVYLVATQNESLACLGPLPPRVTVVERRFPGRWRQTPLAGLFAYLALPAVDVAFGSFYHVFPSRARARVITVHDLSCFNDQYHPPAKARQMVKLITRMVHECDGVVCSSDATQQDFQMRWPHLAHKVTTIYCGVSAGGTQPPDPHLKREHSILAVGTIEPRKNYSRLLDAYERLVAEQGELAPRLIVVGNMGWMSEEVGQRLLALQEAGRCRWLRNASDEQLADAYAKAGIFTYLSLSEGFGYPPFEAAFARCPMVLSAASSVGEIWSYHAKCVDPLDAENIVAGWKWALALSQTEREAVVARQERLAHEFTWGRTVREYLSFWNNVINKNFSIAMPSNSVKD